MTSTVWANGSYQAVANRIEPIAVELVATVNDTVPLDGLTVLDLACGTGSAARAAYEYGARVTAVDMTAELLVTARGAAHGDAIDWVNADASATELPGDSVDAAISSMGIIFVEPVAQVAELSRLVKSGGMIGLSSWQRAGHNPFYDPIVSVLGEPEPGPYGPDDWGNPDTIHQRLADDFHTVEIEHRVHTWRFPDVDTVMHFLTHESPLHVDLLRRVDEVQRDRLLTAFEAALTPESGGQVAFDAPYVIITAVRR